MIVLGLYRLYLIIIYLFLIQKYRKVSLSLVCSECQRNAVLNNGLSLKSLAADLLNITLDKSLELRCSNWEAENLSWEQVCSLQFLLNVSLLLIPVVYLFKNK